MTPVLLIPGLTGTRLQTRHGDYPAYDFWVSLEAMFLDRGAGPEAGAAGSFHLSAGWDHRDPTQPGPPEGVDLEPDRWWLDQMQLAADGITPAQDPDFNWPVQGLSAISALDPSPFMFHATWYCYYVIRALQTAGYGPAQLAAAPYDWRTAPTGLSRRHDYFTGLRRTIEKLYADNRQAPVTIVAHSLGNRVTQYFLQWMGSDPSAGQPWIDRYVARYIAVSPLWIGAPRSVREALTGGYQLGPLSIQGMKPVVQSYGVIPWMFPVTPTQHRYLNTGAFVFLGSDANPLDIAAALSQGRATGMARFLEDYYRKDPNFTMAGTPTGSLAVARPPVAKLDVFYATGRLTEIGAYYRADAEGLSVDATAGTSDPNFSAHHGVRYEASGQTRQAVDGTQNSGDGTVPYGSLTYFKVWNEQNPATPVTGHEIAGSEHTRILGDRRFLSALMQVLGS